MVCRSSGAAFSDAAPHEGSAREADNPSAKIAPATEKAIRVALAKGDTGMHKIAARFGVGTGTVQRIKAQMAA